MITRRSLIKIAAVLPFAPSTFSWSKDEFWNSNDPSQWTEKETTQLLTHSPWAKQTSLESQSNAMGFPESGGMGGGGMGGRGGMGGGGRGGGGMGGGGGLGGGGGGMGGGRGRQSGGSMPDVHAIVRWESAMPVVAAEKKSALPEAAQAYLISLSGLPLRQTALQNGSTDDDSEDRMGRIEDRMKRSTSLERKGKDPISPDHVQYSETVDGDTFLFSFPRSGNAITPEDKEVTFIAHYNRGTLKVKFNLKEMTYKDQLAL